MNHQRIGSVSNAHAGREFESLAAAYFRASEQLALKPSFGVEVRCHDHGKQHRFDLGLDEPAVLVECKSHHWTATGNMPSAKVTVWNEAMYYFHLAPAHFRKILFVLRARHTRRSETLAEYYVRIHRHLIPAGVSILEYEQVSATARYVLQSSGKQGA